jgi:hypothetical protein
LDPLVEELLVLMNGVSMDVCMPDGELQPQSVKAALSIVYCDLPAAKKTSGFVPFNAVCGCHRCKSKFGNLHGESKRDWSGWNDDDWIPRTIQVNKAEANAWKLKSDTGQSVKALEDENGTRYSPLHRLPYFDAPGFTVIEPMHNLYLGTVKHLMGLWLSRDTRNSWVNASTAKLLIDKYDLKKMQEFLIKKHRFNRRCDGRSLVKKITIGTGFSYLKAAEWKAWSMFARLVLKQALDTARFENFMLFSNALRILEANAVSLADIDACYIKSREFCIGFGHLYGKHNVQSNMHFHLHLAEYMRMYDPISCFWAFNFERYNMYVKRIHTNHKKNFEKMFMVQFFELSMPRIIK